MIMDTPTNAAAGWFLLFVSLACLTLRPLVLRVKEACGVLLCDAALQFGCALQSDYVGPLCRLGRPSRLPVERF